MVYRGVAMDALELWRAKIDWSGFKQGDVSDQPMWAIFRDLVPLCHVHKYWWIECRLYQRQQIQIQNSRLFWGERVSRRISGGRPGKNAGKVALLAYEKLNPGTADTPRRQTILGTLFGN
jgi:hypothetical protein